MIQRMKRWFARRSLLDTPSEGTDDAELAQRAEVALNKWTRHIERHGWPVEALTAIREQHDPHFQVRYITAEPSPCPLCGEPWEGIKTLDFPCRNATWFHAPAEQWEINRKIEDWIETKWAEQQAQDERERKLRQRRYLEGHEVDDDDDFTIPIAVTD